MRRRPQGPQVGLPSLWELGPEDSIKRCTQCRITKPITEFGPSPRQRDRLRAICKPCDNAKGRKWRRDNPEKAKAQDLRKSNDPERRKYQVRNNIERNYGITYEEYCERVERQNGVCAICHESCQSNPRLGVDHDHRTGLVRGLLCTRCNSAIGYLRDNPDLCLSAAAYLLADKDVLAAAVTGEALG